MTDQEIDKIIKFKLDELDMIPFGIQQGRRLELDFTHSDDTHRDVMERSLRNLAERMGIEFVQRTNVVALEQFTIMSIQRNDDTAGMLVSLVNSFMIAYLTPEVSEVAFQHLEGLEAARGAVAKMRSQYKSVH